MKSKITERYNPSVHAVERIREYFGILEDSAKTFVNESLRSAKYVTTQQDGNLVYKCSTHDAMIVVNAKSNIVITVLPPKGKGKHNSGSITDSTTIIPDTQTNETVIYDEGNEFISALHTTIKRELVKARRQFTREYRHLTEQVAVHGLEIAQLTLNKARARSPITQSHIQRKIDDIHAKAVRIDTDKGILERQFKVLKDEVTDFVGTEAQNA